MFFISRCYSPGEWFPLPRGWEGVALKLSRINRSSWGVVAGLVVTVALVGGAFTVVRAQPVRNVAAPPNTAAVTRGSIVQSTSASGTLSSNTNLLLNFKSAARLTELRVKVGDQVQAGDILAVQESTDLQAQVAASQANLDKAVAAYQ